MMVALLAGALLLAGWILYAIVALAWLAFIKLGPLGLFITAVVAAALVLTIFGVGL